ncbi:MAG: shikimate dehydrogenase [Deltaproteobacteria bacterium]|nr:shikimate dehydrogenase [Deltaproteobacteria bacterium]
MSAAACTAAGTALYGVTGWPLSQSLSPLLHNTGFAALGINALYLKWEVPPQKLPTFVESVRLLNIRGCSVTIPHKVELLPLLDEVSPLARSVGAANTIYWKGESLCGENTDVAGFMAPLGNEPLAGADVLLLGAGGAARAVAAGLVTTAPHNRPARVFVATPSNKSHLPLADEFGLTPLLWQDRHEPVSMLVINTTPLGMRGKAEQETPYDFSQATPLAPANDAHATPLAYDIVYNPLETRFLREARAAGRRCISGLEMFFGQGDAQFRLWTGQGLPPESRRALETALGQQPR